MAIKNLINLSSIPKVSTLPINLTLQTTSFSLSFDLNMKIDFLNIFCPYTHPHHFRFNYNSFVWRNFGDFLISDSIKKLGFEVILIGEERYH